MGTPATISVDSAVAKICSFSEGFSMGAILLCRPIAPLLAAPACMVTVILCVVVQACIPTPVAFAENLVVIRKLWLSGLSRGITS